MPNDKLWHFGVGILFCHRVRCTLDKGNTGIGSTCFSKRSRPVACYNKGGIGKNFIGVAIGNVIKLPVIIIAQILWCDLEAKRTGLIAGYFIPERVLILVRRTIACATGHRQVVRAASGYRGLMKGGSAADRERRTGILSRRIAFLRMRHTWKNQKTKNKFQKVRHKQQSCKNNVTQAQIGIERYEWLKRCIELTQRLAKMNHGCKNLED